MPKNPNAPKGNPHSRDPIKNIDIPTQSIGGGFTRPSGKPPALKKYRPPKIDGKVPQKG